MLQFRGNPGTHDIDLGVSTLNAIFEGQKKTLSQSSTQPYTVPIPSYSKVLNNGRGDRLPEESWPHATLPLDVVLIEGCFLGFKALTPKEMSTFLSSIPQQTQEVHSLKVSIDKLSQYDPKHLELLNENLSQYVTEWYPHIDAFIHIVAQDVDLVYTWRWEQEVESRKRNGGQGGLSEKEVEDFVDRFVPMYVMWLPKLSRGGFFADDDGKISKEKLGRHLRITIDRDREVVESCLI